MNSTFSEPIQVGAVAVFYKDCVLLGKRTKVHEGKEVPYGGYWSLFGGAGEKGENPMMTASRELREETQIEAPIHHLTYITRIETDECSFIAYAYEASSRLTPVLDFEHTDYGWFPINSLDSFSEKIDPKIVECIKLYKNKSV